MREVKACPEGARRLRAALAAVLSTVLVSPLVHASTHQTDIDGRVALVMAGVSSPVVVALLLTVVQQRRTARTTFAAVPLAAAGGLVACMIMLLSASAELGILFGLVTVPLATAFVAVSWVRLPIWWVWRTRLTFLLGGVVAPLGASVAWLSAHGRSAVAPGAALIAVVVSIAVLHRRGAREI